MDRAGGLPPLHFFGHSTVLVEIGGVRVLTDPVLLPRVSALLRVSAPCDPRVLAGVDLVVISHLHADHLHLPSLRLLGRNIPLVMPVGAAGFLRRKGFTDICELAPGQSVEVGDLRVRATHAVHDGFRQPFGPRAMAVGYLLQDGRRSVYFAGDTEVFEGMAGLDDRLDVALLPVWGWGPRLGPGHLNPAQAGEAARLLEPRFVLPVHWGTLRPYGASRWMHHHLVDPPRAFARAVAERGLPLRVLLTEPGQRVAPC